MNFLGILKHSRLEFEFLDLLVAAFAGCITVITCLDLHRNFKSRLDFFACKSETNNSMLAMRMYRCDLKRSEADLK